MQLGTASFSRIDTFDLVNLSGGIGCVCRVLREYCEKRWEYINAVHKFNYHFKKPCLESARPHCLILPTNLST